ncbi:hypothetical protein LINPERHAP1_LOCUS35657 [Linum perenne]
MSEPGEPKSSSLDLRPSIHEHPHANIRLIHLHDVSSPIQLSHGTGMCMCIYSHSGAVMCLLDMDFSSLSGFDSFIQVMVLTIGWIMFLSSYISVHFLLKGHDKSRKKIEVLAVCYMLITVLLRLRNLLFLCNVFPT